MNYSIKLGESKGKSSVNATTELKIPLNATQQSLPLSDINEIVDEWSLSNKERQNCKKYRLIGTINPLISNPLFNVTGPDSWLTFNDQIFNPDSAVTFTEVVKNNLIEIDGWFGYLNPILSAKTLCNFIDMEPKRSRFSFLPDGTNNWVKNWEVTVSYPYTADTQHFLVKDGLFIVDANTILVGGKPATAFATPVKHNLSVGDIVNISGTSDDGDYEVIKLGLTDGSHPEYWYCVNQTGFTISNGSRMTKKINNEKSSYYFRKFKKIATVITDEIEPDDYELYKLAFSENVYRDDITQYVFNEDINVEGLVDNLGRPISEIFVSLFKTDSNNIFTPVKSGIESPFISNLTTSDNLTYLRQIPVIQRIHNGTSVSFVSHQPLETNITVFDDDYYGDVVEYNKFTLTETILAEVQHQFNTINREISFSGVVSGPRYEGYYYSPHQRIKIRSFSTYIEQGDISTDGIPEWAENLGDGRFLWRDLVDIGQPTADGLINYPFLNGVHNLYTDHQPILKRQDPFDNWDLFYSGFPSDPIGNTLNPKVKININNDAC